MTKKVLVTGAAGFIGSQLSYDLHKDGYHVIMVDDMSFGYEDNLIIDGETFGEFHKLDIRSEETEKLYKGVDTVYHFAGISALPVNQENPYYAISVNVAGTANVLECARKNNVRRVIFASTSAIYENNETFPSREEDVVSPYLLYSNSKLQSELLCKSYYNTYGLETVCIRFFNVYGPHQDFKRTSPPFTSYVIRELLNNRAPVLHSSGDQKRDYVYVDDLNRLNRLCMEHPNAPGGIFNAASGVNYSVKEIYAMLAEALNSDLQPVYREAGKFWDKYPSLFEGSYPLPTKLIEKEVNKYTLGAADKALKELGWKAEVSLADGMRITAEYAKKNQ
jgi:nucleoside-diphosphate-sugar epimerase